MEANIWEKALVGLTPGGSEYVGDPERCVAAVKEYRDVQHRQIIKLTMELKRSPKWVKVNDRLPNGYRDEPIFIKKNSGERAVMYYNGIQSDTRWKHEVSEWLED